MKLLKLCCRTCLDSGGNTTQGRNVCDYFSCLAGLVCAYEKDHASEPIAKLWVDERQSHVEIIFGVE